MKHYTYTEKRLNTLYRNFRDLEDVENVPIEFQTAIEAYGATKAKTFAISLSVINVFLELRNTHKRITEYDLHRFLFYSLLHFRINNKSAAFIKNCEKLQKADLLTEDTFKMLDILYDFDIKDKPYSEDLWNNMPDEIRCCYSASGFKLNKFIKSFPIDKKYSGSMTLKEALDCICDLIDDAQQGKLKNEHHLDGVHLSDPSDTSEPQPLLKNTTNIDDTIVAETKQSNESKEQVAEDIKHLSVVSSSPRSSSYGLFSQTPLKESEATNENSISLKN